MQARKHASRQADRRGAYTIPTEPKEKEEKTIKQIKKNDTRD